MRAPPSGSRGRIRVTEAGRAMVARSRTNTIVRPSTTPGARAREVDWRRINLTASPLPDIGGLGLVALGAIVAVARPTVLWMFLPALLGGVVLGLIMVMVRRHATISRPASPTLRADS